MSSNPQLLILCIISLINITVHAFIGQSSYRYGHSKLNSCLSGYLLKKLGSVGRLEKENESMNIIIKWA